MNEFFVSKNENGEIIKNIFITIGFTVACIIIVALLAWGYYSYDNKSLFIIIYSVMVLIYCIVIISVIAIDNNNYDTTSYTIIFSTTIFTVSVTFFVFVLFIYKFFSMKK